MKRHLMFWAVLSGIVLLPVASGANAPSSKVINGVRFLYLGQGIYGAGSAAGRIRSGTAEVVLVNDSKNQICSAKLRADEVILWGQNKQADGSLLMVVQVGSGPATYQTYAMGPAGNCALKSSYLGGGTTTVSKAANGTPVMTYTPNSANARAQATPPPQPKSPAPPKPKPSKGSYCNARYAYCLLPPAWLFAQGEAENGDGQVFLSRDAKVSLAVWGNMAGSPGLPTLAQAFQEASRGWSAGSGRKARVVTYKLLKPDFFVVSGLEGGKVFYQRTVRQNGGQAHATYLLTYPEGHKEASRIISMLNATLAFY